MGESLKTSRSKGFFEGPIVDSVPTQPSAESNKLEILRQIIKGDSVKQELLRCLSDGLWHTTTELARQARSQKSVMGMVTVGTILSRMQEQLSHGFLEQMIQKADEGVSSWRMGVEWLEVVKEVLRQAKDKDNSIAVDEPIRELENGQPP